MAKNNLKAMRLGDLAFFYHSNIGREIVGVVEVVREAYPDPSVEPGGKPQDWVAVDMQARAPMPRPVSLAMIKSDPALAGIALIRLSRLSVCPISAAHWAHICERGGYRG
jgi:predicted RNA-binding protein with PUA-like domain